MNISERRLNIDHTIAHILFQAMAGIVYGFSIYLLMERNFSSTIAGISMSLSNLSSMIIQPCVANFLDKSKKYTVFDVCVITSILMLILYLSSCFISNGTILLVVIYTLSIGIYQSLEPLFNSLCSVFNNSGLKIEFGKARAFGSLAYGLVCFIFGALTETNSYVVVLIGGCIFATLITLICLIIRNDYNNADKKEIKKEDKKIISFIDFVKTNKMYIVLCICLVGIFFGYTISDNFTILIVENVGGNSKDMGTILFIKALLEGIFIFCYSKVRKHIKLNRLLVISMLGFIAKGFVIWRATKVSTIYIAQLLQIPSFAIIIPAMVEYINANMDNYVAMRGQALFTMTIGIGSTFSSLAGGYISDTLGVSFTIFIGLVVTIISAITFISSLGVDKAKQKRKAKKALEGK